MKNFMNDSIFVSKQFILIELIFMCFGNTREINIDLF